MSDPSTVAPQQLFKQWRGGDAASGQAMAQRFSDWYYAVTACRLGDQHGRTPLQRACTRFQQGIVSVTNPGELADWAHGILSEELRMAGGRIPGGDFPNQLTRGRPPSELLARAREALPPAQVRLLAHAYDARFPYEQVAAEAEALGGMPFAVLDARYALKRWLAQEGVAFTETPAQPNLDYAPLPLYEAGRMSNANEESGFEKWMLLSLPLCKDIAEFGVFALALRAGAFGTAAPAAAPEPAPAPVAPAQRPAPAPEPPPVRAATPASPPARSFEIMPFIIGLLLVVGIAAAVAAWFTRHGGFGG